MSANHYHKAYEVFYLFQGQRNYFIKDTAYPIQPGDLVLVNSNDLHKTSQLGEPSHERIVLYFAPSFFEGFPQEEKSLLLAPFVQDHPIIQLNLQEKIYVEGLLLDMLNEAAEQPPCYSTRIRNIGIELLLFNVRHFHKRGSRPDEEIPSSQRKVTDIVRHINLHYGDSLQLDDIAKQFYIKSHLSRIFKKVGSSLYWMGKDKDVSFITLPPLREFQRLEQPSRRALDRCSNL
jgi:hypothetical protein